MRFVHVMNDAALIIAHQSGDRAAFETLVARHRDSVMGFLVNRVGDDAEDLFQETWSRVGRSIDAYEEAGTFRAWVFQIARRLVIDHHRRKSTRIQTVSSAVHATPSPVDPTKPDQSLEASQLLTALQEALSSLPESTAEVLRLRLVDGWAFRAIADHQGVSLNTALSRMHRGLNRVRAILEARDLIHPRGAS